MSRYHSYLNSAVAILEAFRGEEPFAAFLKKYFSVNKKFGSKDRKQVVHLCYSFFRMGKAAVKLPVNERILAGLLLCSVESNEMLAALKPEWNKKTHLPLGEKLLIINSSLLPRQTFPWKEELSDGIEYEKFCESFFIQPDLFLRIRPGKTDIIIQKLKMAGCRFRLLDKHCISLPNATKIEDILEPDKEAVIQDFSSQRTSELIKSEISNRKSEISLWDCCAASGGKSIMAYDISPEIELTVSDIRESILGNLKKRFDKAGIKKYKVLQIDLSKGDIPHSIVNNQFSIIVADVPCTGSGTWSRTPEQLYYFNEKRVEEYTAVQKKILSNVIPHLQPGGHLMYITCSVFRKENEEMAEFMKSRFGLEILKAELLKGYDKKADTLFAALLQKPL